MEERGKNREIKERDNKTFKLFWAQVRIYIQMLYLDYYKKSGRV